MADVKSSVNSIFLLGLKRYTYCNKKIIPFKSLLGEAFIALIFIFDGLKLKSFNPLLQRCD